MPNSRTFSIPPIARLLEEEVGGGFSIDPFFHGSRIAKVTNDLCAEYDSDYHLDAIDFLRMFDDQSVDTVLYDPPYSPRQIAECYRGVGREVTMEDTQSSFWANHKREISRIVRPGGKVISFGWNSGGMGKKYGFDITRILLVPHGGAHNDTICVVEVRK